MDPCITGVWQNFLLPQHVPLNNNNDFFAYESGRETAKNESMADDNTTIALLNSENLGNLRRILDDFGDISGLRCNYSKTKILKVGPDPIGNVETHGFAFSDSIVLLGMEIKKELTNVDEIFMELAEKILKIIRFWELFRLSLPGRITVIKTLLLPQLNYLGCILTPSDNTIRHIQGIIDAFARKNLRISNKRLYMPAEVGGLGLFELGTYLDSQRCAWIKRALTKPIDNWRFDLKRLSPDGDITRLRCCDIDRQLHPILYNIVESFTKLAAEHAKLNGNYKSAFIFSNPAFTWGLNDSLICKRFFGRNLYDNHTQIIRGIRLIDCYSEDTGIYKTMEQFNDDGLPLTVTAWVNLRSVCIKAANTYKKNDITLEAKTETLSSFFLRQKKGSKATRKILEKQSIIDSDPTRLQTVVTFAGIINLEVPTAEVLNPILRGWNLFFLPNDFREFIFKERNNALAVGAREAHFDADADERCTFCRILFPPVQTREDFIHLFYDCPITDGLINNFLRRLRIDLPRNRNDPDPDFKKYYWYGTKNLNPDPTLLLIFELFRYCLWKFKTRRILPRIRELLDIYLNMLETMIKIKLVLRNKIANNPLISNILQALG